MSYISGGGLTAFSRDAGLTRGETYGLVTGYSTTLPHLILATVFAEHFGVKPHYVHAVQFRGATGRRW